MACGYTAFPIHLLHWLGDCLYVPQLKWKFLLLRTLIVPGSLFCIWLLRRSRSLLKSQWILSIATLSNAFPVATMLYLVGDYKSPYYGGIMIIAFGIGSFFPLSAPFFLLQMTLIFGPSYLISAYMTGAGNPSSVLMNAFVASGAIGIAGAVRYTNERIFRKEFKLRVVRERDLMRRDRIIRRKTREAIELQKLANQFSPQIVAAIKNGGLTLLDSIHKSTICAIFIDIVNSTDRIKNMNDVEIDETIKLFMEDTMKVLLKHDVTIDKFLGDGILGFANDPVPHPDFIERVVDAALEIRNQIDGNQPQYAKHWTGQFQIRIGVAVGDASVGFYGSDELVKSYTALGRPVNFASRLCSNAQPGQILLSSQLVRALPLGKYKLVAQREVKLKGFESEPEQPVELVGIFAEVANAA